MSRTIFPIIEYIQIWATRATSSAYPPPDPIWAAANLLPKCNSKSWQSDLIQGLLSEIGKEKISMYYIKPKKIVHIWARILTCIFWWFPFMKISPTIWICFSQIINMSFCQISWLIMAWNWRKVIVFSVIIYKPLQIITWS